MDPGRAGAAGVKRRLHVPPAQLARGNPVALTASQARYVETVLRLRAGTMIEVFDGEGRRFEAELTPSGLRIGSELPRAPESTLDVWLAQAIVKGDKLDLVVQKATELGVSRLVLFDSSRSVVKLDDRRAGSRVERLRRVAEEAARQCDSFGRAPRPARIGSPRAAARSGRDGAAAVAGSARGVAPLPRRRSGGRSCSRGARSSRGRRNDPRLARPARLPHGDGRAGGARRGPAPGR
ncbi:MAG: 16S rRNA (uracil(1498)-N(3))-methyltransferase [Deltaproteobacteria bacterium]|nr:MAG: 16S rRNA (uracil(1498)-N(3))-methyltransferase [Deltaproteobacteria bacterium]